MSKKLTILILLGLGLLGLVLFLKYSSFSAGLIWQASGAGAWLLPLVTVAALIDSVNPCAFSVLVLTIAFLFTIGKLRTGILKIGGAYIAGIFAVYVLIGLGLLQTLHLFDTPHFMAKIGSVLLILLGGINLINHFFPAFPLKLQLPASVHRPMAKLMERGSGTAAFFLGALVAVCEFPCTGGPYLMVLGLLHDQGTYLRGLGYLLYYNLLFIVPLVIILLIASDSALVEKIKAWKNTETKNMRLWGGIAMVLLGALIFFL